ncbi:SKA complex subunit 2-like [Amphiura filiformis]|uniref:SKA complex subunit 2-like n=1 Tax=Amphiura filiformis TaxID=82378 RepID=UPI003B222AA0
MEGAADKLETLFRKAESDLDYMSRKLDNEFGEHLYNEQQLNPGELTQRLQQVKKEYSTLVAEAEEIKELQSQMCDSFKSQIQATCMALQQLNTVAPDAQGADSSEQQALVESLLKMSLPKLPGDANAGDECTAAEVDSKSQKANEDQAENEVLGAACSPPVEISPSQLRSTSNELVEVTKEEFMSVSSLVYRVLFRHFKEEGNKDMLSVQEMSKMGMRITGNTGEAKLKVLRALKLLQISKTGSVKLL